MKKIAIVILFAIVATTTYSFRLLERKYDNIFNQLGFGTEEAESYIVSNIVGGSTSFPHSKVMVNLALNKREQVVQEIGNYIKAYIKTPSFEKKYNTTRLEQKPEAPTGIYRNEENMAAYREDLKRWEKEYPASFNELLKRKLTEFLALTSVIDFNAKLERRDGKMVFANNVLEEKDSFWKACFRSGKVTVDAARTYAKNWLLELK